MLIFFLSIISIIIIINAILIFQKEDRFEKNSIIFKSIFQIIIVSVLFLVVGLFIPYTTKFEKIKDFNITHSENRTYIETSNYYTSSTNMELRNMNTENIYVYKEIHKNLYGIEISTDLNYKILSEVRF